MTLPPASRLTLHARSASSVRPASRRGMLLGGQLNDEATRRHWESRRFRIACIAQVTPPQREQQVIRHAEARIRIDRLISKRLFEGGLGDHPCARAFAVN